MKQEQSQSIAKEWLPTDSKRQAGFSLVEVILATAVFGLLVTALVGAYLYGQESTMLAGNHARAVMLADEGLEAVRNLRDSDYTNLTDGTYGLTTTGNQWNISGSSDVHDIFTRQVVISTIDEKRKEVACTISWQQNPQRTGSVTLTSRMTHWQQSNASSASMCHAYAIEEGYSIGICRQNTQQCENNGETYLSGGDTACIDNNPGNPSRDTCCALSELQAASMCHAYAIEEGYSIGICRQNTQQCENNGETYLPGGDTACTDNNPGNPSQNTCCAL